MQGRSKKGLVTVSAKVEEKLRNELDEIKTQLNLKNRSEAVKLAIKAYISNR
ncbi:MAG: ribbon-helix-helix protein, CopG family [Thermoplasmata archaeon]|nr:ribbon-helix-helix protein, CopG family [Thermoplasmata archaeon]